MAGHRTTSRKLGLEPPGTGAGRFSNLPDASSPRERTAPSMPWPYRAAVAIALALWLGHVFALPIGITYDGHVYIDLAGVLGSSRFPADWNAARTPLFPLALKVSMWLFGRQPLACIAVSSLPALAGLLALGFLVKRTYGPLAGGCVILVLSCYPTLTTYGHFVLTETGTFCFIAISLCIVSSVPNGAREAWRNAWVLAGVIAAGDYWRQNIFVLALPLAAIHAARLWNAPVPGAAPRWNAIEYWRLRYSVLAQAAVILIVPYAATYPWRQFADQDRLAAVVLHYGIVKQALPSAADPILRNDPAAYRRAIDESVRDGHLYSGLRSDLESYLNERVFAWPAEESAQALFIRLARRYPDRYIAGVGRSFILFFGAPSQESENRIFRGQILSRDWTGSKIGEGPPAVTAQIHDQFLQRTTDSALLAFFRMLTPFYDGLIPAAFMVAGAGLVASLFFRCATLFTLCAIPLFYLVPYALVLSSVDRYAFPVYPVVLAAAIATVATLARRLAAWRFKR